MIALNKPGRIETALSSGDLETLSVAIEKMAQEEDPLGFAIAQAIEGGMYIAELEAIGITERVCNMLDKKGIQTVEDLLNSTEQELLEIPNMGKTCLSQIKSALLRLPELEEAWDAYIAENGPNYGEMERIRSGWGVFEGDLR